MTKSEAITIEEKKLEDKIFGLAKIGKEKSLRKIKDDEIVLEYDNCTREEGLKWCKKSLEKLEENGYVVEVWDHNGKSMHLHIKNITKLDDLDSKTRKQYKLYLLKKYSVNEKFDETLTYKEHYIAAENELHYKKKYEVWKSINIGNEDSEEIKQKKLEKKKNLELCKQYTEKKLIKIINEAKENYENKFEEELLEEARKTKKRVSKEKDEEEIICKSFLKHENLLIEQVYKNNKTQFCVFNVDNNSIEYKDEVELDGIKYRPLSGEEIEKGAIKLPSEASEYNSDEELEKEIWDFTFKYSDISDEFRKYCILHIKRSWVYDKFHTLSYLRGLGNLGTGKSRFLDTIGLLHYKPIKGSGAVSSAALKRIIEKWKGSLLIDEGDIKNSDETNEIIKIINLGFEKGQFIYNCSQQDYSVIEFFDPFCPKVITTRRTFEDQATESRCMTEVFKLTDRKDIPVDLNDEFYEQQLILRNKLLMWRFKNYYKIDVNNNDVDLGDIEPRLKQINIQFVALFKDKEEELNRFRNYLKEKNDDILEARSNSLEGKIIFNLFILVFKTKEKNITCSDIINYDKNQLLNKDGKKISTKTVSTILKSLNFNKPTLHRKSGTVGKFIDIDKTLLLNLCEKYGLFLCDEDAVNELLCCENEEFVTDVTDVTLVTKLREKYNKILKEGEKH